MLLAITYGIVIEVLQEKFTLTRKADFNDVIANIIGVISAVILNKYVFKDIYTKIFK